MLNEELYNYHRLNYDILNPFAIHVEYLKAKHLSDLMQ